MKVLWLCSTMLPNIADDIGIKSSTNVSWIVNAAKQLSMQDNCELCICFPMNKKEQIISGCVDGILYYGFPQKISNPTKYNRDLEKIFEWIVDEYKPDIIHVWGTEYPHTLSMMKVCEKKEIVDKAIISIQGLCHIIEKHYYSMLPNNILRKYTFYDLLKRENICKQRKKHQKRGCFEIEALKIARNVIGRTEWDEACVKQINPDIRYHFCNETLRENFYNNEWDYGKCQKYSIFLSQGYYPIKGLHLALEAVNILKKDYPDILLHVGGLNMIQRGWKTSAYGRYIQHLMKEYELEDNVTFTGMLDEKNMVKQYLKANVFVSASTIENSPNSVGEAMCLGVPVVSSDVGGVKNLISHGVEGYIYPSDEPYMLAFYVKNIFENIEKAKQLGKNARRKGLKIHSPGDNLSQLVEIYLNL